MLPKLTLRERRDDRRIPGARHETIQITGQGDRAERNRTAETGHEGGPAGQERRQRNALQDIEEWNEIFFGLAIIGGPTRIKKGRT